MFTGIVEATGKVADITKEGTNSVFFLESPITDELHVNQSLSHNGVCLTITGIENGIYTVTAVEETLIKSNLGDLRIGDTVNLERSMSSGYRFDGHIVQGHVDQTGTCTQVKELEGSWLYDFEYDFAATGNFLVEKGSICVNGVSLTAFNCENGRFRVTIIPFTFEHTNFEFMKAGDRVNLEFDVIGKYIQKLFSDGYLEYMKNKLK
ncbi:riboflavin synthase [Bacteroidota bacterium]